MRPINRLQCASARHPPTLGCLWPNPSSTTRHDPHHRLDTINTAISMPFWNLAVGAKKVKTNDDSAPVPEYYRFDIAQLTSNLGTDLTRGLTNEEAANRLAQHGPNSMGENSGPSALKVLANSVFNSMNAVLFVAFLIAAVAQDPVKSTVLMVIIATNSYLSFVKSTSRSRPWKRSENCLPTRQPWSLERTGAP
ncbi:hypothetical protein BCR44DRAFT_1102894 [Catenaria anguillulae PL171]|uniref:Cation-transporting P-type ATPase N-terminal domain-containing protein n=1 Tax=Catenaria anguillulae PL171 TaxID=765915 RepID=A0A1Y2I4K5_9FUNG|nr:hypothetical protein BCR44DRAFT_1102894 [Catenaria anguillulae PL171]